MPFFLSLSKKSFVLFQQYSPGAETAKKMAAVLCIRTAAENEELENFWDGDFGNLVSSGLCNSLTSLITHFKISICVPS